MKIAYVSGPYRAKTGIGVLLNIWKARRVAIKLWKMGFAVICPHTNSIGFPDGALRSGDDIEYIEGDCEIISRLRESDALVLLPSWEQSEGARKERKKAIKNFMSIYEWPEDIEKLKKVVL